MVDISTCFPGSYGPPGLIAESVYLMSHGIRRFYKTLEGAFRYESPRPASGRGSLMLDAGVVYIDPNNPLGRAKALEDLSGKFSEPSWDWSDFEEEDEEW